MFSCKTIHSILFLTAFIYLVMCPAVHDFDDNLRYDLVRKIGTRKTPNNRQTQLRLIRKQVTKQRLHIHTFTWCSTRLQEAMNRSSIGSMMSSGPLASNGMWASPTNMATPRNWLARPPKLDTIWWPVTVATARSTRSPTGCMAQA